MFSPRASLLKAFAARLNESGFDSPNGSSWGGVCLPSSTYSTSTGTSVHRDKARSPVKNTVAPTPWRWRSAGRQAS